MIKPSFYYSRHLSESISTAQRRWQEEGIDFGDNWQKVFSIPFDVTSSTRLQSLQYRILHRFFPTRRYLCIRTVVDDPYCDECGEEDTIQHYFMRCHAVQQFWDSLVSLINRKLPARNRLELSFVNIIFGCPKASKIVNVIILLAKQCIVTQRARGCNVSLPAFMICFKKMFEMEKYNAHRNQRMEMFVERWKYFMSRSGDFDL